MRCESEGVRRSSQPSQIFLVHRARGAALRRASTLVEWLAAPLFSVTSSSRPRTRSSSAMRVSAVRMGVKNLFPLIKTNAPHAIRSLQRWEGVRGWRLAL